MKKAVASSTLFQTGFSMLTLGGSLYFVSLLRLVGHALFKSCLFIEVGIFIHNLRGQQDSHEHRGLGGGVYFIQLQILVTLFCLCRLVFRREAVTKDITLEVLFFNFVFCFLVEYL